MLVGALSADSQAIALLCSTVALPPRGELSPLSTREWDRLRARIHLSPSERPGELLGKSSSQLAAELQIPTELADRVENLLSRGGQLALELERLESRGMWMVTRADDDYPARLRQRLGVLAPAVLFGAGERRLLAEPALAIVGSRDVADDGLAFAAAAARRAVADGLAIVSGAARGVDSAAMAAAVQAGGFAVGVLADSLERVAAKRDYRHPIAAGCLTLVTSYHPSAKFNVGNAMRRNRLIYCLSEAALVVASTLEKGGTRAGALEDLEAKWVPLLVRADGSTGNSDLIRRGGRSLTLGDLDGDASPFLHLAPVEASRLDLEGHSASTRKPPAEPVTRVEVQSIEERTPTAPAPEAIDPEPLSGAGDLFPLVWPRLERYLAQPRSEKDVAVHLRLETSQARAWLRRAQEEGLVERCSRKRRYTRSGLDAQPPLFETSP